jgi:hypothetical protein
MRGRESTSTSGRLIEKLGDKEGGDSLCEAESFAVANSYRIFASWGCRRAADVEWMEGELDS